MEAWGREYEVLPRLGGGFGKGGFGRRVKDYLGYRGGGLNLALNLNWKWNDTCYRIGLIVRWGRKQHRPGGC